MAGCSAEVFLDSNIDADSCLVLLSHASQAQPQENHVIYSFDTYRMLY